MKTRYKILLIFGIILILLFASFVILKITFYETWGNNDHYFYHPQGYEVECEFVLYGHPGSCIALNENGRAIEAKTGVSNWKKIHSGPSPWGMIIPTNEKQCAEKSWVWYENHCLWVVEKTAEWKKWDSCGKWCKGSLENKGVMSDEKRMEILGHIDSVSEAVDYLREKHNIHLITIGTDHENHALRIGMDLEGLSDSEINNIEKQIRKIVRDEIDITIEHSEPIYIGN